MRKKYSSGKIDFEESYTYHKCPARLYIKLAGFSGEIQEKVFENVDREQYFKLPKPATNPRGVEISKEALSRLMNDKETRSIKIMWRRSKIDYNPYRRWIDYWKE